MRADGQAEDMGEKGQCVCIIGTSEVATVCRAVRCSKEMEKDSIIG
jgi:hypothetical protein